MSGKDVSVVLAVDDDPDARALLDRALSAAGFAMVFAHDGEAALTLLEDMTPDLILLDAVRSEEHTSELQSLMRISYAVFCLKKKNRKDHECEHRRHEIQTD